MVPLGGSPHTLSARMKPFCFVTCASQTCCWVSTEQHWQQETCCTTGSKHHVVPLTASTMLYHWQQATCFTTDSKHHVVTTGSKQPVVPLAASNMLQHWQQAPCCNTGSKQPVVPLAESTMLYHWQQAPCFRHFFLFRFTKMFKCLNIFFCWEFPIPRVTEGTTELQKWPKIS